MLLLLLLLLLVVVVLQGRAGQGAAALQFSLLAG
jgi:hypothetical protein